LLELLLTRGIFISISVAHIRAKVSIKGLLYDWGPMGIGGIKNGVATSQGATFSIISKTLGEFLLFPVAHRHVNRLTSHNGIRGHQQTNHSGCVAH
jgi:hypothetical protein